MLERLIIIHNAIKAGMYPNNAKLRRLYCEQTGYSEVGEATIYRDIFTLQYDFHAPIEFDRQKGGYHYTDENWEFALNKISADEVFYLSAAKMLLSSFEGSPVYDNIAKAIDFLTDSQGIGKSALLKRIAVPPAPKVSVDGEIWQKVLSALNENLVVVFDYTGIWKPEPTKRRVMPYQILMDDGKFHLFGYDLDKKAERLFSLSRMKNFVVTEERFSLPKDFEFSSRCGGGKFGAFISEKKTDFIIDFFNDGRRLVKECIWSDNQKITEFEDEAKTRIEFSSTQSMKVMEWILSQGSDAAPIAPDWFVAEWKRTISDMARRAAE